MNFSSTYSLSTPSSSSSFSSPANGRRIHRMTGILCCFGALTWYGSDFDQLGEEGIGRCTAASVGCAAAAPGIVARLMGLESLPRRQQTRNPSGSPKMGGFLDYQELEDEKFIILSFEHSALCNRGKGRSTGIEKENEEVNVVSARKLRKLGSKRNLDHGFDSRKNEASPGKNPSNLLRPPPSRNSVRKPKKRREKNLKYDGDDESESSSANSVLNCASGKTSESTNSKFQRTNSHEFKNKEYSFPENREPLGAGKSIILASARKTNRGLHSAWKRTGEVRELSSRENADLLPSHHWHHAAEIGGEMESQIFGLLLDELLITFL